MGTGLVGEGGGADMRARLIEAAAGLIAERGARATTTRAVAQAAGVQPPAIYRTFGDKDGMLDAVAEAVFADYVGRKNLTDEDAEPVQQLRDGFDRHVAFGLAHPAVFALISANVVERPSRLFEEGMGALAAKVRLAARAGRLKTTEESAVALIHAMGTGTVFMLLAQPAEQRERLAIAAREAVLGAVLADVAEAAATGTNAASTVRADLDRYPTLTPGERHLMEELLTRMVAT